MWPSLYICLLIAIVTAGDAPGKTGALIFDLNKDNFNEVVTELLEKPKETLPIFIAMMMGECTVGQCPKYMKDIHLVAEIVKRQARVAVVDCGGQDAICHRLPKPEETKNSIGSIYLRSDKIYAYEGNQTKQGLLDFLSADNYKESTILEEDYEEYVYNVLDKHLSYSTKFKKNFEEFSFMIEEKTETMFKKVPLASKWTKTTKVLLVSSFVIPPCVFTMFWCFLWLTVQWTNRAVDAKYAKINQE